MKNFKKELEGRTISLVVIHDIDSTIDIIRNAAKNYKKICYVSFNKPYHYFLEYLKVKKIDPNKFFIIDCITKSVVGRPKKAKNCVFVSSPSAFAEVNDVIRKTLQEKKFDFLIFDSLSSVLIYEKELFVTRFLHTLVAMIKGINCKAVFIILKKDVDKDVVHNLGMLTDKTIYLR